MGAAPPAVADHLDRVTKVMTALTVNSCAMNEPAAEVRNL